MQESAHLLKGVSLERLATLEKVVRAGSIGQAAGASASAQAQYSRQIADLEVFFDAALLDRTTPPHRPTELALRLADLSGGFFRELGRQREQATGGRVKVVIGAGERVIRSYLLPWAARLPASLRSEVRMVFRNLTKSEIRADLAAGRLDFGVLGKDDCPPGCDWERLGTAGVCLWVPDNGVAKAKSWKSINDKPLIMMEGNPTWRQTVTELAADAGVSLDVAMECSTWSQVAEAMVSCKYAGWLPEDFRGVLGAGFSKISLPGLAATKREFGIAWSRSAASKRPTHKKLVEALKGRP